MILNQSVIDIFAGLAVLTNDLVNKLSMVPTPTDFGASAFCHLFLSTYLMGSLVIASTYNLVYMTLERYYAITNPMKYDRDKVMKRLPLVMLAAWVTGK